MRTPILISALATLALVALPTRAQTMTGQEILETWGDRQIEATLPNGNRIKLLFRRDGSVEATGSASDKGVWTQRPGGYCTKWTRFNRGEERCFTVLRRPDGGYSVRNPDGSPSADVDVIK